MRVTSRPGNPFSDGSASVSFADGESAGAGAALGLVLPEGPKIGIRGGGGLGFTAGRTWEFPSFDDAARFVRRWAPRESLGGEAKGLLHKVWPFSRGHRPPAMPAPDASYVEGGPYAEFSAIPPPRPCATTTSPTARSCAPRWRASATTRPEQAVTQASRSATASCRAIT